MKNRPKLIIRSVDYDAAVFDLDGVITRTAKVHAKAWKKLFDEFLAQYGKKHDQKLASFDVDTDYYQYVDGKPRYQGVKSFLDARNIRLPWGKTDDPPGMDTICELGNWKNEVFHQMLQNNGVEIYETSVALVQSLKEAGLKVGVVSSSKNCAAVLKAAHLSQLFEKRVDGLELERLNLKGKPDPDIFVEAVHRLGAEPDRALVFEDAISGVKSGRKGGFKCVVGVDRENHALDLAKAGADVVVQDLSEVQVVYVNNTNAKTLASNLPSALDRIDEIKGKIGKRRLACFFDYDGTLTPIVDTPQQAILKEDMRQTLKHLAELTTVTLVSGRGLSDVRNMVGIQGVFYAGSHGFEISGPGNLANERASEYLPMLDKAEKDIEQKVQGIPGAFVERKKYSIAIHFRKTPQEYISDVEMAVNQTASDYPELRKSSGKKIFELQPRLDWNKGKAILWLMKTLGLDDLNESVPLYIGDDTTDEDAFSAIQNLGITIVVDSGQKSSARYQLKNPQEVQQFLESIIDSMRGEV